MEGAVFVDKPGIPIVVRDLILPVFTDLSKPDLLKKCLHGKTQNNNECLNGVVVRKRIPKDFVGRKVLEIGICSAMIHFNAGATGFCNSVMKKLCLKCDRKSSVATKNSRKRSRAIRKGFGDTEAEKEGDVNLSGGF